MDPSEKFNFIKRRFAPEEVDKLEESLRQIKEVEALFSDNHAAHEAFLNGIHSALDFSIAVAAGDENPEQVFDSGAEGKTGVEEIRRALRTLVQNKTITPEEAGTMTWDAAQELLEAGGAPLCEISEETRGSAVYVAEPPPLESFTEAGLIMNVELRRAAADRHRQQTHERSWNALVTHIEEICQLVIKDSETLHQGQPLNNPSSPDEFQEIARLLSYVPKQFRRQAFCQCILGTSEFERMPIIVEEDENGLFSIKLLNVRIPMPVPFVDLCGGKTIMTWLNAHSGQWEHQIPSCAAEIEMPKTFLDLNLESFVDRTASDRTGLGQMLFLVQNRDPDTVGSEWRGSAHLRDLLQSVHSPDINHGTDPWYHVIRMARASFGSGLSAEKLIKLMGLTMLKQASTELATSWPYAPKRIVEKPFTLARFKEIYRNISKQKQSMANKQVDQESVRRIIEMIS